MEYICHINTVNYRSEHKSWFTFSVKTMVSSNYSVFRDDVRRCQAAMLDHKQTYCKRQITAKLVSFFPSFVVSVITFNDTKTKIQIKRNFTIFILYIFTINSFFC